MPSIERAMAQSLHQRGLLDVLVAAVRPVVYERNSARDIQGQISDVKTAFSSWDNCMNATYCKWPVIAVIIIGGLIIISVVWCIARCACCGLSCCCECFHCLKCCGNCCGCCDAPNKPHKYLDEPYGGGPQNRAYRSEERMLAQPSGYREPAPIKDTPQFATFDVSTKKPAGGDDALPEMPSWESATHTKVPIEGEPVELDSLQKPTNSSAAVPLMAGSGTVSPIRQPSPGNLGLQTGMQNHPYAPPSGGMSPNASTGYLGAAAVGGAGHYGQNNNNNQGYGHNQGYGSQNNSGSYGDDYHDYGYGGGQQTGYTSGVTSGSSYDDYRTGSADPYAAGSTGGAVGPYGQNAGTGARSASNIRALNNRPPPQRQYTPSNAGGGGGYGPSSPHDGSASPNLQSNGGFDFSSGFSRPQQPYSGHDSYGSNGTFGYNRTNSPAPVSQTPQASYPGYRPYNGTGSQNF